MQHSLKKIKLKSIRIFVSLLCALTFISLIYCIVSFLSQPNHIRLFATPDVDAFATVPHNLIYEHGSLHDWHLPFANYLFPDFTIAYLSNLFFPVIYSNILIFAALQVMLFLVLIVSLFWQATKSTLGWRLGILSSLFFLLNIAVIHHFQLFRHFDYLITILVPGFHFGAVLIAFVSLLIFIHLQQKNNFLLLALLTLLLILTGMSDALIHVYFTFPLMVMLTILYFYQFINKRKYFGYIFLLMAIFVVSHLLYRYMPIPNAKVTLKFAFKLIYIHDMLKAIFVMFIKHNPIMGFMWLAFIIYTPISLSLTYNNENKNQLTTPLNLILLFEFLTVVVGLPLILFGLHTQFYHFNQVIPVPLRYLTFIIVGPVFLGFPLLLFKHWHALTQLLKDKIYIHLLLIFAVLALLIRPNFYPVNFFHYYPKAIACVDKQVKRYHLHNALTFDYATAAMLSAFNQTNTHVAFVTPELSPAYWWQSNQYYRYHNYDFVLLSKRSYFADIKAHFGEAKHHVACQDGKNTVFLYTYNKKGMTGLF